MATATTTEPQALTASTHKRRHSAGGEGEGRVVKHRASKACRSCRTRKVRCDVSARGSGCTNCELDNLECIVLPSRRGHSNRTRRNTFTSTTQPPPLQSVNRQPTANSTVSTDTRRIEPKPSIVPAVVTFEDDGENTGNEQAADNAAITFTGGAPDYEAVRDSGVGTNSSTVQLQSPDGKALLPAFIAPIPARVLPEDIDYLALKGAFVAPEPDLCVEILRAYLFSVHPFMPMLSVRTFARALLGGEGQVSLLLFQAVMFAGLHSLRLDVVRRLGFQSPKEAREVFFNRVRLLYDFNVETDNAAILQSLILMSSWYSKHTPWNERRHTWHWTGLAYDLARSMGLHREPDGRQLSAEVRCFRRRLWWSLYIRDRLIALGTRRPMRIQDTEFDVAMLTLVDFDVEPTRSQVEATVLGPSKEDSTSTALMCIQLARLCVSIGHVVSSQYTTLGTQPGASMMVMPRQDGDHTKELEQCEKELDAWIEDLSRNVRRTDIVANRRDPLSCSEVHWAELNMTYHTVFNVLHRAQALRVRPDAGSSGSPSRLKVKSAARNITKLGQDMLHFDQVRFLGLIGVTAFLAACLTHMLDAGSTDEDVRDASTFRLYQSLQVLQALREVYASADSAFSFLASVTRKIGICLPMQVDTSTSSLTTSSPGVLATGTTFAPSRNAPTSSPAGKEPFAQQQWHNHWPNSNSRNRSFPAMDDSSQPGWQAVATGRDKLIRESIRPAASAGLPGNYATTLAPSTSSAMVDQRMVSVEGDLNAQFVGTSQAGFSSIPADGNLLDWNNGIDTGIGLGSMPFTYDFFSDAFGFLDNDLHAM